MCVVNSANYQYQTQYQTPLRRVNAHCPLRLVSSTCNSLLVSHLFCPSTLRGSTSGPGTIPRLEHGNMFVAPTNLQPARCALPDNPLVDIEVLGTKRPRLAMTSDHALLGHFSAVHSADKLRLSRSTSIRHRSGCLMVPWSIATLATTGQLHRLDCNYGYEPRTP